MKRTSLLPPRLEPELIRFAQQLVRIKSVSGDEKEIISFIERKMNALGYDEVIVDSMGNVVGRIGTAKPASCSIPTSTRWM